MRAPAAAPFASLLVAAIGCGPEVEDELTHGTVQLEFRRGESQSDNPLVRVDLLDVTMTYLECLSDFYDEHPELRQASPDGDAIFGSERDGGEGWRSRLCESEEGALLDCSVNEFVQELDTARELTVRYAIFEATLVGGRLAFGPLPTAELAQCEPRVRLEAIRIPGADPPWEADASAPIEATTNQAQPITIAL